VSTPARPCRAGSDVKPSAVIAALRRHADDCWKRYGFGPAYAHVLRRLFACRTAALGEHLCVCEACGWKAAAYNSCRDRHCPQCQGHATALWLEARQERMLPTPHFQVVFTLPAELRPIAYDNQKLVYGLLFRVASSILQDLARQRLNARLGITSVLHTWSSELNHHPHLHCLVTGGGLHLDGHRWVPTRKDYLFPGRIIGTMFRGRFLEGLIDAFKRDELHLRGDGECAAEAFHSTVRTLSKRHNHWVVHVEAPKGRPVEYVTKYLARYVKRVAISDGRILSVTATHVTFKTKRGVVDLGGAEFVHRFLLHVLPSRFRKVRHYGLYAPGKAKVKLEVARRLCPGHSDKGDDETADSQPPPAAARPLEVCPNCGLATVRRIFTGTTGPLRPRAPP